jgi:phospholipid/cholesterol/gamma-HCH transport system permease protein
VSRFFKEIAGLSNFFARFFREVLRRPFEGKELLYQCYVIGCLTLPLVAITAFIMGVVLTIQSRPTLVRFGAEAWLPGMVAVSIVREVGPVITALICAGKVGSGIGAELGSMRVTEQIDAMEVSGTNPFKFLVVTRALAAMLMVPLLTIFSDFISLYGSYVGINIEGEVDFYLFATQVRDSLDFIDLVPAIIKTFFFGFFIGLVGAYKGFNARGGTAGVGMAANAAVVMASLTIFILDMIAVQITSIIT